MGLLVGNNPTLDEFVAAVQAWAAAVDGVNAELSSGVSGLSTVKTGTIHAFGGSSAPSGYLLCDGSAVSRTTYASLFAAIGTTWGVGNGSTTFNLPDGRGRYFFGQATSGTGSTLGGTFGTKDHTHTGPSHVHSGPSHQHSGPSHQHNEGSLEAINPSLTIFVDNGADAEVVLASATYEITGSTGSAGTGNTGSAGTGNTGAAGTGDTGTANPPSFVGNWIIKT